jgi:uncharacterized surface protein with fasciclin (FAS1) repeats
MQPGCILKLISSQSDGGVVWAACSPCGQIEGICRGPSQRYTIVMKISIINPLLATAVLAALTSSFTTQANAAAPAEENIVAVASANSDFSTLVAALSAAELVEALQGAGPFTVFAPNNAAFAKLPAGTVDDLLKPENKAKLTAILKNHVVAGKVMAADVKAGAVPTIGGGDVVIAVADGSVKYGDATVIGTDVAASNGVIHVIDTVVLPD